MLEKEFDLPNFSDELVDKWEQIGFLNGIKDSDIRVVLSNAFEYLLGIDLTNAINAGSTAVFAAARRVITELTPPQVAELKNDFTKLSTLLDEIFDRVSNLYEEYPNGFKHLGEGVDWEAEFIRTISSSIASDFS
jgi:hypothetical protein